MTNGPPPTSPTRPAAPPSSPAPTPGLGYETAAALAANGAHVVLAVRNLDKGKAAADLIARRHPGAEVTVQELDLTSLDSVREAAEQLRAAHDRIDLLINNAGVMMTPKSSTKDGFELQFGTNHLGHFALTGRLLDLLVSTPGSRVVTVSSIGHRFGRIHFDDLQSERSYNRVRRLWAVEAGQPAVHLRTSTPTAAAPTTIAVAAHPGGSSSELARHLPGIVQAAFRPLEQDTEMGALPTLRAATDPTCSAASTSALAASPRCAGTRKSSRRAGAHTRAPSSAGCGRCRRSSRGRLSAAGSIGHRGGHAPRLNGTTVPTSDSPPHHQKESS